MYKIKNILSGVLAVATIATMSVTVFATDYGQAPASSSSGTTVTTPVATTAVSSETVAGAIAEAENTDSTSTEDTNVVASVEVASTSNLKLSASVVKELANSEDTTLKIISPKLTIEIASSDVKNVKKVDLSTKKVVNTQNVSIVKFKSKKELGMEIKVVVTACKLSPAKLKKAHVYCDGVDLGAVELNEDGDPVITVTKGGTYTIK